MNEQQINQPQDDNLQGHNSALINAKFSDAAPDNQRDVERALDADAASAPSYELHLANEGRVKETEEIGSDEKADVRGTEQADRPKRADEAETAKLGEDLGGTTNLSPDQLREEGGAAV